MPLIGARDFLKTYLFRKYNGGRCRQGCRFDGENEKREFPTDGFYFLNVV